MLSGWTCKHGSLRQDRRVQHPRIQAQRRIHATWGAKRTASKNHRHPVARARSHLQKLNVDSEVSYSDFVWKRPRTRQQRGQQADHDQRFAASCFTAFGRRPSAAVNRESSSRARASSAAGSTAEPDCSARIFVAATFSVSNSTAFVASARAARACSRDARAATSFASTSGPPCAAAAFKRTTSAAPVVNAARARSASTFALRAQRSLPRVPSARQRRQETVCHHLIPVPRCASAPPRCVPSRAVDSRPARRSICRTSSPTPTHCRRNLPRQHWHHRPPTSSATPTHRRTSSSFAWCRQRST